MSTLNILIISYILVCILGVLLHFTHQIFRKGVIVHIFSAVNESTWEHMKLAFYPMLLFVIIHSFILNFNFVGFWGIALITVVIATFSIPIIYKIILSITHREITFVSIALYFVCIFLGFLVEYILVINNFSLIPDLLGILGLIVLFFCFVYFTYRPLHLKIFRDPIYNKYGEFKQKFDKKK